MQFIDLKEQQNIIRKQLEKKINKVLDHGKYIMGPEVFELEEKLVDYTNTKYCISCSSGTDALLLALMSLNIGPGDKILVPDFSFFATAGVVSRLNAEPVFLEIDPTTFNLCPKSLEEKLESLLKMISALKG